MVYGMVQRHNAELEIDSAPGQGTTVRISFPLALTAVDGTIRLPALPQALGSLDILIVDDDPLIIESLRATLESADTLATDVNAFAARRGVCHGDQLINREPAHAVEANESAVGHRETNCYKLTELGYHDRGDRVSCDFR